ncbi:CPX chromosomal region candidate gene 1 protein [Lepus europaeus]|uniref:CPX chromosomal region candidate gene 1 protein n=1 Tax=Lepus europaeus TaxID=9983 RepID=UPI002B4734D0|nr:CPX chromosomal region candidate gene 1 protein [Lepus europaeus]
MTSPTNEGSDTANSALKNAETEAQNDCNTDIEPSAVDSSMISEVESNPAHVESTASASQENAVSQAEDNELKPEKIQKNPQKEDINERALLVPVPIPRKWGFLISGLGREKHLNVPPLRIVKSNFFVNRPKFYSGDMEMDKNDNCHSTINCRIPFHHSIPWRIPFINNCEIKRMILRTFCGRNLSQITSSQSTMCVKQKYMAVVPRPNILTHGEGDIVFRRHSRVYPIERMTSRKFYITSDTKVNSEYHTVARPMFYAPRIYIENTFRKSFEDYLQRHHNIRAVIVSNNGWKYVCPICGNIFNNLVDIRQHSCSFPGN